MSSLVDPGFDEGNVLGGELRAFEGHGRLFETGDATIQSALLRPAGDNRNAMVAAAKRTVSRAHVETGCAERAMTTPAVVLKHWLNVSRK
jgi:hypothetical protein